LENEKYSLKIWGDLKSLLSCWFATWLLKSLLLSMAVGQKTYQIQKQ
jgi:hypothetical protein